MANTECNLKCEYKTVGTEFVKDDFPPKTYGLGVRHAQTALLFACLMIAYMMRVCISVAVIAMTTRSSNDTSVEIFDWDKKTQDVIMSSFNWGYVSMQVVAGQIAHRYGAKHLIIGAMICNAVVSGCVPWFAHMGGWMAVCFCRIIQGLTQSCILPSLHTLLGKWSVLEERSRLSGFIYGGSAFGTVLGMPLSGLAAGYFGWSSIFWGCGASSFLCGLMYAWLGAESPQEHGSISEEEKNFILNGLGNKDMSDPKRTPVPWKEILTSLPVWACAVAHLGNTWGQLILYTEIPSYMAKVMGVDIKQNGFLSALPFLSMWIMNFVFSYLADLAVMHRVLSVTDARKVANTIGSWVVAAALIVLAYLPPTNIWVVEGLLLVAVGTMASAYSGFKVNMIDISPNYAGTIMSLSNTFSNGIGVFATLTSGLILYEDTNRYLWRYVFLLTAAIFFLTNLFYIFFGSSEKASWNSKSRRPSTRAEELEILKH